VLAGGNGNRLGDLTRWPCKPALPFGGHYRNVDFSLSNAVNSGIRRIALLTQYKAHSLIQHVQQGWSFLRPDLGEFVEVWPAQQRCGTGWCAGTADSLFQNADLIEQLAPDYVLVLAGDHIYRMDYRAMLETHVTAGLGATVGCVEVPIASASEYGIIVLGARGRVERFEEKPARPTPLPSDPTKALASMGIYLFDRNLLLDRLAIDAGNSDSRHDFGRDILPSLLHSHGLAAHRLADPDPARDPYWRDVGTLDSYWQAHMELLHERPNLDLHDGSWPLTTYQPPRAPARFVGAGAVAHSIVSARCIVAGRVEASSLAPGCRVGAGSLVQGSVLLKDVIVGRDCRVRDSIVDAGCVLPDGFTVGYDATADRDLYDVSPRGVVLVTAEKIARAESASARAARHRLRAVAELNDINPRQPWVRQSVPSSAP
jgi:glucose-1-phosphate adenylyltransferase